MSNLKRAKRKFYKLMLWDNHDEIWSFVESTVREALKATELEEIKKVGTTMAQGFNEACKLQKQKIKDYLEGIKYE